MDMTLQKFMSLAITAVIIFALVFGIASTSIKAQSTKYKTNIESPVVPTNLGS